MLADDVTRSVTVGAQNKKPNLVGWAICLERTKYFWLPNLDSNQGPAD